LQFDRLLRVFTTNFFSCVYVGVSAQLLQVLVKQNEEIKQQVLFNTQLLQEFVRKQRGKDIRGPTEKPCSLPLKIYEEVRDVEQKLKSKEFYSNMVIDFKIIC
jgi:hypothetical protein